MNNEKFPEVVFLYLMINSEEDCKRYCDVYDESWFARAECGVIFQEIRAFLKKHHIPPSVRVLRRNIESKDSLAYEARFKEVLDQIDDYAKNPDKSEIAWTKDKAQDVATIRAFKALTVDLDVQRAIDELDGVDLLRRMNELYKRFDSTTDRQTMNIREAVESLVREDGFTPTMQRVPTGIDVIDKWCGGGLRPKQLGILVGVTGHGKSVTLVNIADRMARVEDKRVWLITNELSLPEVTERFMSRISGVNINDIMDAPAAGLGKINRQWAMNHLDRKLLITDYMRPPISSRDIEEELIRNKNLYGFTPDVIVLDFMERMKGDPEVKGRPKKFEEWANMQFIAQDLVALSKRYNLIIWTAVQTNRSGAKADDLDISHVQASIRHIQEATACIALKQRKIVDGDKTGKVGIQFFNLKQRQSALTFGSTVLEADLSRMNITNIEAKVIATTDDNANQQAPAPIAQGLTAQQKKNKGGKYGRRTP